MTNLNNKKLAVLISNGRAVAQCYTAAENGDVMHYGFKKTEDGKLIEIGTATVSRAKKYLADEQLMHNLSMQDEALVNIGGGECI